jgi:acyl-CoA thioester hydrolase
VASPERTAPRRSGYHPWPLRETFEVTFRDLDLAGHVNNSVVFTWMETLRLHHYMQVSGLSDPLQIDFILAEAAARYFVPVRYQHQVIGEVTPSSVGRTSWGLMYRFTDGATGTVLMRSRSVQVAYDYQKREKKAIPPEIREKLLATLVDPASEGWPPSDSK